jgi:hypothetical protein
MKETTMKTPARALLGAILITALGSFPASAQHLHTNHTWKECAFVIDPSLTAEAWHQFVGEAGLVTYFRPLASARPLGAKNFEVAVMQWSTGIDDADAAWNDTFSHPDSTHWLFDGGALPIPGLMVRAGVSDRVDVGAYFTKNVNANYGIFGGQVQYSLLDDAESDLAAAGRVSVATLFGPEDLSVSVYGVDFLMSKDVSVFSPYAGVSGYVSRGQEHTSKVDLENETIFGVRGTAGVSVKISVLRLGAEYTVAEVPSYSFKVAFGS